MTFIDILRRIVLKTDALWHSATLKALLSIRSSRSSRQYNTTGHRGIKVKCDSSPQKPTQTRGRICDHVWADIRPIHTENPQNVDVQKNSTQNLPRGFEDFWNPQNEISDSKPSFWGYWVRRHLRIWGFEDFLSVWYVCEADDRQSCIYGTVFIHIICPK